MSRRGLSSRSLADLQKGLMEAGNMRRRKAEGVAKRELIVPGEDLVAGGPVRTKDFPNPVYVGGIAIRYYDPAQTQIPN
jgi:hypothetical protein